VVYGGIAWRLYFHGFDGLSLSYGGGKNLVAYEIMGLAIVSWIKGMSKK
jgi:hypothetical protein